MTFDPVHNNYMSHADWLYMEEQEKVRRIRDRILLAVFAVAGITALVGTCQYMGWL